MLLDQLLRFCHLFLLEAEVRRKLDERFDPEFRFSVSVLHMNMSPSFLARKEVQTKPLSAQDGWTHSLSL